MRTCRWMLSSEVDVSECRRYRSCWNSSCRSVHRPGSNSFCSVSYLPGLVLNIYGSRNESSTAERPIWVT
jgi:hypothetical protein